MFDSHVHTEFSSDSKMTINQVLDSIEKNNIGIILTEHLDLNYPHDNMFKIDVDNYINKTKNLRSNKLLIGIEIGFDEDIYVEKCKNIASNYDFDFVLGSTHIVEGIDLYEQEYYKNTETGEVYNIDEVYDKYFKAMLRMIKKNPYFDSMAHIDYISRYAARHYEDSEIYYDKYSYIIDDILKELVHMDKAMEINTRRLNDKNVIENFSKIYGKFRDLGGRFVTIGSDSHEKESIGINFKKATELAENIGLKPVYFKERKRILY